MFRPADLLRPHLKQLVPYSSARDDYKGSEGVFLDANENPLGSITQDNWNRYPDPYQKQLKERLSQIKGVRPEQIFLGNGSDEPIDLLFRAFCEPGKDEVIINPPTYGMYKVSADINNIKATEVLLTWDYDLDIDGILNGIQPNTKIIWICSPNNPTGNDVDQVRIEQVLKSFQGIVVVDEAYIDFSERKSWIERLNEYPNLVVLQTMSKAWGLAALRLGMAFCSPEIIAILNSIKPPYNLSGLTQETVYRALDQLEKKDQMVSEILENRAKLKSELEELDLVERVYPTDANFFLVRVKNARDIYVQLIDRKIILRDRSKVVLCEDGIRITIGTKEENARLIQELKELSELIKQ
ncbi:histidinol-phosphate transaminase [Roseivirga sp.]|uniref:histidinol-phosphate transaminase n=1 Tax=Roseivirga sp. TaxID=1964215 RepID=UPI003B5270B2